MLGELAGSRPAHGFLPHLSPSAEQGDGLLCCPLQTAPGTRLLTSVVGLLFFF